MIPANPEAKSEILPTTSSILCTATVPSAADVSVISESDAKLVSPKLSEIVPAIIPNRSKMKGPRGRKPNKQYSKTIEEVVKENTGMYDTTHKERNFQCSIKNNVIIDNLVSF